MRRIPVLLFLAAVPALAADHWTRISTPNFELYTTANEKQGKDTIRHFERVREFFLQASPIRSLGDFPLRIVQFDTEAQFNPFRPADFNIAYFIGAPMREYIVMGDRASSTYAPSIHEYMHLIVRHSGLKLPVWLNEGWADVFSTLRPMGKDTAVGDLLPDRMKVLATGHWLDFDTLTSVDTSSPIYHEVSRVGIFYAESWALAHMLFLSPEYKDNFGKFVMALHSGKTSSEACEIAFGRSSTAVFEDLHSYLDRKRIFGTVFETRLDNREAAIASAPVSEFDARLNLADLLLALRRRDEAKAEYARLEAEQPNRPDLSQSIGYLALMSRDIETARRYFTRAYDAGNSDSEMCYQLAMMDREAKQPPAAIIPILERALKSKPGYTDAKVQLGLLQVLVRDFPAAISTLMSIPKIAPRQAEVVFCPLAYAYVQTGDLDNAMQNVRTCQKWAKSDADTRRADRLLKLIEARAKPSVAVHSGEKLQRVTGIAHNLQCSSEGNRLQIAIGDKLVAFDLPEPDAVELPAAPAANLGLNCGALKPTRIAIEFAPPRSAVETSAGIVRRLDF
jgi:Flp pilus assembly protein TadD